MDDKIFNNLSWNVSIDNQIKAINELASMANLNPCTLIQPSDKEIGN